MYPCQIDRCRSCVLYFFSRHCLRTNSYENTTVEGNIVKPTKTMMKIKTDINMGKVGVMLVGIGGNNGKICSISPDQMKVYQYIYI